MSQKYKASIFLNKLKSLSRQDLLEIKGIGEVLADNFLDFTSSNRLQNLITDFEILEKQESYLQIESSSIISSQKSDSNLILIGQTICITGTFELSRNEIKEKLENLGAKVVDTVSTKTTILLAGQNAGSKLAKAQKMNIKVVNNLTEILG